jgi:3',5'-cyclic AMP phosphodiesterase CpdA
MKEIVQKVFVYLKQSVVLLILLGGLMPLTINASSITVGIIGDQTGATSLDTSYAILQQGIDLLKKRQMDMVIHVGDLVESTESKEQIKQRFSQVTSIINQLGIPWNAVAGDHDVNPPIFVPNSTDRSRETLFLQLYSKINPNVHDQLYYSFDIKGYHFIGLYSEQYLHTDPRWGNVFWAEISDDQYAWLQQDLKANKNATGIIVFVHQPLWYNWTKWSRVHALLEQYPVVAVIAGHYHYNQSDTPISDIDYIIVGATGGNTKLGNPNSGDLQHVSLMTINGRDINIEIIPINSTLSIDFTPRANMDRIQVIDQVLGNLYNVGNDSAVFVDNGELVKACGSSEPAELVLKPIGNPLAIPVNVTISATIDSGTIQLSNAAFASDVCQTSSSGPLNCTMNASVRVSVANTSIVKTALDPCTAQSCQYDPPPPFWKANPTAIGTAPVANSTITLKVIFSYDDESQNYMIYKNGTVKVHGCS